MQKVELYYDVKKAKCSMDEHIRNGWRIHTCAMSCDSDDYHSVLVVYEKD